MPAAAKLLRRATTIARDAPECPRWLVHAGEALAEIGEFRTADEVLGVAEQRPRRNDVALATEAGAVRRTLAQYLADPVGTSTSEVTAAGEAIRELERPRRPRRAGPDLDAADQHPRVRKALRSSPGLATNAVREAQIAGDRVLEVRLLSGLACCPGLRPHRSSRGPRRVSGILGTAPADRRADGHDPLLDQPPGGDAGDVRARATTTAGVRDAGAVSPSTRPPPHWSPGRWDAGRRGPGRGRAAGDYACSRPWGESTAPRPWPGSWPRSSTPGAGKAEAQLGRLCRHLADPHAVGAQRTSGGASRPSCCAARVSR